MYSTFGYLCRSCPPLLQDTCPSRTPSTVRGSCRHCARSWERTGISSRWCRCWQECVELWRTTTHHTRRQTQQLTSSSRSHRSPLRWPKQSDSRSRNHVSLYASYSSTLHRVYKKRTATPSMINFINSQCSLLKRFTTHVTDWTQSAAGHPRCTLYLELALSVRHYCLFKNSACFFREYFWWIVMILFAD